MIPVRCQLAHRLVELLRRIAVETDGQDLIEYALVTTFIGRAGAAVWNEIQTGLGDAYGGFNDAIWGLWVPADCGSCP